MVKGYSWSKRYQKWAVVIGANGRVFHMGYVSKEEDAKARADLIKIAIRSVKKGHAVELEALILKMRNDFAC
jgi:hypothetical protein